MRVKRTHIPGAPAARVSEAQGSGLRIIVAQPPIVDINRKSNLPPAHVGPAFRLDTRAEARIHMKYEAMQLLCGEPLEESMFKRDIPDKC
jgi:hypothetical protein